MVVKTADPLKPLTSFTSPCILAIDLDILGGGFLKQGNGGGENETGERVNQKKSGRNISPEGRLDLWNSAFWPSMLKKSGLKCDEIVIEFKFWCEFERGGSKGA